MTCLGPSSLLKFVNGDQNQVKGDFPIQHAEGSGVLKLRQSRPYRLPKRNKERSGAESQSPQAVGHYKAFRFQTSIPRANLTTRADRVASRLVHHIKGQRNWGWVFSMQYLQHLPKRLSESPSLRDTGPSFARYWEIIVVEERQLSFWPFLPTARLSTVCGGRSKQAKV